MTTSLVKLVSGETLLCEIVSDNEYSLTVNNPIAIMVKNRVSPVMVSHLWLPFDDLDNEFVIRQEHVITKKMVDDDMIIYYNNCIDTIHENMTASESFLMNTTTESEEDAKAKMKSLIDKLESQYHYTANTVLH